jgi:hypothetical protein
MFWLLPQWQAKNKEAFVQNMARVAKDTNRTKRNMCDIAQ